MGIALVSEVSGRLHIPGVSALIALAVAVFATGFTGTLRVWFLRIQRQKPFGVGEVSGITTAFIVRFLVLGIVIFIPLMIIGFIVLTIWARDHGVEITRNPVTGVVTVPRTFIEGVVVVFVGIGLVIDILLTFVIPALSLTTSSPRRAMRLGLRMVRLTWPKCAWYVLAPGLTLGLVAAVIPASVLGTGADVVIGLIGAAVGLWFKGANVAFYLRAFPDTGDDGSAHLVV